MGWRDKLVEHIASTIRIEQRAQTRFFAVSMAWENQAIDMRSACNHLARSFKATVTVERQTAPADSDGVRGRHTAFLRFSCDSNQEAETLKKTFDSNPKALALVIVSNGT